MLLQRCDGLYVHTALWSCNAVSSLFFVDVCAVLSVCGEWPVPFILGHRLETLTYSWRGGLRVVRHYTKRKSKGLKVKGSISWWLDLPGLTRPPGLYRPSGLVVALPSSSFIRAAALGCRVLWYSRELFYD
jgi:hypothetical protein